jgi:DNA-binding response OmpR family regulator
MENIGILIIDDAVATQAALRQVLGAEGWFVEATGSPSQAFQELATGKWSLVLANVETTGVIGALFTTLRELAQAPAPADAAAKAQVRVLFLVPESAAAKAKPLLEQAHLPYVPKPLSFNDLLERVSDLLVEAKVIGSPIRQVRERFGSASKSRGSRDAGRDAGRNTGMFARNEDYQWSEEELLEYDRQEVEARKKKKKPQTTLG